MLSDSAAGAADAGPVSGAELVEEPIDEVRLFMLFALFGGDVKRVSVASGVELRRIEALAHDFNWKGKLNGRGGIATETGQEEERVLNRVTNYVTAERLKRVYARLVDELDSDPKFARQFCTHVDPDSGETSFSSKNLVDLTKGLQIANDITYRALQDKQAQAADVINKSEDQGTLALKTFKALVGRFDSNAVVDTTTEILKATADARAQSHTSSTE